MNCESLTANIIIKYEYGSFLFLSLLQVILINTTLDGREANLIVKLYFIQLNYAAAVRISSHYFKIWIRFVITPVFYMLYLFISIMFMQDYNPVNN